MWKKLICLAGEAGETRRAPRARLGYDLAWTAPGWIGGGNFWSTDMINCLVSWLNCAKSHGLAISYLGGWNERGYNISWYEQLRSALNADRYSAVQIVGADSDWSIVGDIASNSAFASAVQVIAPTIPARAASPPPTAPSSTSGTATAASTSNGHSPREHRNA